MASDAFIKFYPFEAGLGTEGMDTVLNLLAEPLFIALKWIANDIHSQLQSDTSAAIDHLSSLASHKEEDKKMELREFFNKIGMQGNKINLTNSTTLSNSMETLRYSKDPDD